MGVSYDWEIYLLNSVPISLKMVATIEVSTAAKNPLVQRLMCYLSHLLFLNPKFQLTIL